MLTSCFETNLFFLFTLEYSLMDTPQSPCQSPQSPEEEEERGFSDSKLLESSDEEDDRLISDSEMVNAEENDALIEEGNEDVDSCGRDSELGEEREEDDEVVPDFVSDPEDDEPVEDGEGLEQEDGTIMLVEGDEDCPQEDQLDGEEEKERGEQGDRVIDTPQSPDSDTEQNQNLIAEEEGEDHGGYNVYQKQAPAEAEVYDEEEDKTKVEDDDRIRAEERRRAIAVREMKDDSSSVTRELDEHELDYDEEVPDESSIPAHEEEDDEEEPKVEGEEEEESEDKSCKKEKKTIMPPSPKDNEFKRTEEVKGPERVCRDSFRDKKKDEDDGEIDEGEIDVSVPLFFLYGHVSYAM